MSPQTACPKCNGRMEPGFIVDKGHHDHLARTEWVEGAPEGSFWTGLKTKGRDKHPIRTDRCMSCGYLESYALPESKE